VLRCPCRPDVDRSIPNLSSIVLLVGHHGRTALLTGDARGDHVLAGLTDCGLLTDHSPLFVDLLELPHHGSENNVERSFFERVRADHYVVSADGIKHHHPSEQTLRWLVESRGRDDAFSVHRTNRMDFAVAALEDLRHGRSFEISARPAGEPSLGIDLGAQH
jgi:beta-lactamase superfamily II metal-dependent hydrolase